MPRLADAAGVATWYEDTGTGDPVVLLHGGIEGGESMGFAVGALAGRHRVLVPDRRGHGRTADVEGPYTYRAMADEIVAFLDQVAGAPAHLVGYSDGGIVALQVALDRPDLVRSVVAVSANVTRDGLLPEMLRRLGDVRPDSPRYAGMRAAHAAANPDGPDHWPVFLRKVFAMGHAGPDIGIEALARLDRPVLVVAADDDVVDHHHTVAMFEALPQGRLAVVPGTSHALPAEKPDELMALVRAFLDDLGSPPARLMPMRTAPRDG